MATQPNAVPDKTIALSVGADVEIDQLWAQVEERVLQMAKGDRSKIQGELKIEDVLTYLDQVHDNQRNAAEKYSTARHIFSRTLQAISTVGGIIADGASNVFAPASMCYNALTFVIQAWRGYEGIFDSLAALLEKLGEFFERLVEYSRTGMNKSLSKVACQYLELFVLICDRALDLRRKRVKVAAFMKQLFLNDDGMQEFLARMQKLTEKEYGLVSAQTWSKSTEAASNSRDALAVVKKTDKQVGSLVEGQNQERKDKETKKWQRVVAKALELDPTIVNTEKIQKWEEAFNRHKKSIFDGSGEWLAEDWRFTSWLNDPELDKPILGLEGGDGTGKTTLTASIIARLKRAKTSESLATRSCAAYYFFEKDSKSTASTREIASTATQTLLWQLAIGDEPYMKSLASICEKAGTFTSSQEMWTQLLLDNEDRVEMNSAFFIIVDGLDENVSTLLPLLHMLSNKHIACRTRVLLTGSKSVFDTLDTNNIGFNKITLGESNRADIKIYVTARMDSMDMLKDAKRPDVTAIREKILNSLVAMTDGDYYKMGRVLDDIERTDVVEDIETLLESSGLARLDKIEADLDKLNEIRTTKEIAEINEIILWINEGRKWLKPEEMEAALALRGLRESNGTRTSLMSLDAKIRTKYSIFVVDTFNEVDYKVEGIKDKIPFKKRHDANQESPIDHKEIQAVEINIIKHHLSTICPPDVYRKFGFDEFFKNKMIRKENYICQDPDNSHIKIALRCLTCLIEDRTEKTEALYEYSIKNLLYHLNEIDLSLSDRELKSETGTLLVRLFTEAYGVSSLFWSRSRDPNSEWQDSSVAKWVDSSRMTPYGWCDWLFSGKGLGIASKMLQDSAVSEKIKGNQLVTDFKLKERERHLVLFNQVAKKAARHLFREEQAQSGMMYNFLLLLGVLTKAGETTTNDQDMSKTLDSLFSPNLDSVALVEDWAQTALEMSTKDALWEAQKAALLLHFHHRSPDVITRENVEAQARKALELDSANYIARYTLTSVIESREGAISALESLIEKLKCDSEWCAKDGNNATLAEMMVTLGDKYWEDEAQSDLAINSYSQALDVSCSPMILSRYFDVLRQYDYRKNWKAVLDCLEKLITDLAPGEQTTASFILRCTWDESSNGFPTRFIRAVKAEDRWDLVKTVYGKAMSATTDYWLLFLLRRQYGDVLMKREAHEDAALQVWGAAWDQSTDPESEHLRSWVVDSLSHRLVATHLQLAKSKSKQPDLVDYHYGKIAALYKEFEANEQQSNLSRLAFVRYFHLRGDDFSAKRAIQKVVIECLDMLSDDDIENDYTSFWDLGMVFSVIEDIPCAQVAWEMMAQSLQESHNVYLAKKKAWNARKALQSEAAGGANAEVSTVADATESGAGANEESTQVETDKHEVEIDERKQSEEEDKKEADPEPEEPETSIAFCDGDCGVRWNFPSEIWTCAESGSVQLNEECYQKLQAGTLEVEGCSKDHSFYFIGKRDDEKACAVPKAHVMFGDKIIKLEDWKAEVKAKYVDLDESSTAEKE